MDSSIPWPHRGLTLFHSLHSVFTHLSAVLAELFLPVSSFITRGACWLCPVCMFPNPEIWGQVFFCWRFEWFKTSYTFQINSACFYCKVGSSAHSRFLYYQAEAGSPISFVVADKSSTQWTFEGYILLSMFMCCFYFILSCITLCCNVHCALCEIILFNSKFRKFTSFFFLHLYFFYLTSSSDSILLLCFATMYVLIFFFSERMSRN